MKRNKIIMAVCFIAAVCSFQVFAAGAAEDNALWYAADKIADASESVLPVEKTVVWEELNSSGEVVSSEEFSQCYGEVKGYTFSDSDNELFSGQQLVFNFAGASSAAAMRSLVNDGLFWTPFDEGVDNLNIKSAEVKPSDVKVTNTGIVENVDGSECLIFNYSMFRDLGEYEYNFEQTVNDDYIDAETGVVIKITGKAWIDNDGVMKKLESIVKNGDVSYSEIVSYDYDGTALYPTKSVLEGILNSSTGDMIIQTNFRATETMSDYWIATDFYR